MITITFKKSGIEAATTEEDFKWMRQVDEHCGSDHWCGRDSHRPDEYVCGECNGCLDDDFNCESCSVSVQ